MNNTRVWRRFLYKCLVSTLKVSAFIAYGLSIVLAAEPLADYFGYRPDITLFLLMIAGIFIPLIVSMLHSEFKHTRYEIEVEDMKLMQALKKENKQ